MSKVRAPVDKELNRRLFDKTLNDVLSGIELFSEIRAQCVCFAFREYSLSDKTFCLLGPS